MLRRYHDRETNNSIKYADLQPLAQDRYTRDVSVFEFRCVLANGFDHDVSVGLDRNDLQRMLSDTLVWSDAATETDAARAWYCPLRSLQSSPEKMYSMCKSMCNANIMQVCARYVMRSSDSLCPLPTRCAEISQLTSTIVMLLPGGQRSDTPTSRSG